MDGVSGQIRMSADAVACAHACEGEDRREVVVGERPHRVVVHRSHPARACSGAHAEPPLVVAADGDLHG